MKLKRALGLYASSPLGVLVTLGIARSFGAHANAICKDGKQNLQALVNICLPDQNITSSSLVVFPSAM